MNLIYWISYWQLSSVVKVHIPFTALHIFPGDYHRDLGGLQFDWTKGVLLYVLTNTTLTCGHCGHKLQLTISLFGFMS